MRSVLKQIYNHLSGILIALCKQIATLYQSFIAWQYMLSKVSKSFSNALYEDRGLDGNKDNDR